MSNPSAPLPYTVSRLWKRFRDLATLFVLCATGSYVAVAAVVSMQQPDAGGGVVRIPVVMYGDGDEALSGLQFDIEYDPARYAIVEVTGSAALAEAGKEIITSEPASGSSRVLITGFNDNVLSEGLVATVVLRPLDASGSPHSMAMDNILASDPMGNAVDVAYEDLFAFPPAVPEKTEETPEETTGSAAAETLPDKTADTGQGADGPVAHSAENAGEVASSRTDRLAAVPGLDDDAPRPEDGQAAERPGTRAVLKHLEISGGVAAPRGGPNHTQRPQSGLPSMDRPAPGHNARPVAGRAAPRTGQADDIPATSPEDNLSEGTDDGLDPRRSRILAFAFPEDATVPTAGIVDGAYPAVPGGATVNRLSTGASAAVVILALATFIVLVALRFMIFGRLLPQPWRRPR